MGARHGSRYGWRHLARHLPRHPDLRRVRWDGIPAQVIRWCAKRIHQGVDRQGKGSLHRQAIPKQRQRGNHYRTRWQRVSNQGQRLERVKRHGGESLLFFVRQYSTYTYDLPTKPTNFVFICFIIAKLAIFYKQKLFTK